LKELTNQSVGVAIWVHCILGALFHVLSIVELAETNMRVMSVKVDINDLCASLDHQAVHNRPFPFLLCLTLIQQEEDGLFVSERIPIEGIVASFFHGLTYLVVEALFEEAVVADMNSKQFILEQLELSTSCHRDLENLVVRIIDEDTRNWTHRASTRIWLRPCCIGPVWIEPISIGFVDALVRFYHF
jgi:hypothetical protein